MQQATSLNLNNKIGVLNNQTINNSTAAAGTKSPPAGVCE